MSVAHDISLELLMRSVHSDEICSVVVARNDAVSLSVESGADNECKVKSHLALAQIKSKGKKCRDERRAVIDEVVLVK